MLTMLYAMMAASQPNGITYLECVTDQYGEPKNWNITLNEPQGTAEYNTVKGPRRAPAQFTANEVKFIGFTLSRVNLTMQRPVANLDLTGTVMEKGSCKVVTPAARAF